MRSLTNLCGEGSPGGKPNVLGSLRDMPTGTTVMHTDLDKLITTTDMGVQEQQWCGGANRQAQPNAHKHQRLPFCVLPHRSA